MMTKDEFMNQMDLILDGAKVNFDSKLEEIAEWDSIAIVSLLSLVTSKGKKVVLPEIQKAETVEDLYELISKA